MQPLALQRARPQFEGTAALQVPRPSQVRAGVKVEVAQLAGMHVVAGPYLRQARAPSQKPSLPQVAAPSSLQSPSGSSPLRMGWQVPSGCPVFACEQASQVPLQVLPQQTPSMQ